MGPRNTRCNSRGERSPLLPWRRGLTPRVSLECNPEIHVTPGVWFYIWIIKFKTERLMKLMVTKLLDFENHWFSHLPAKINWSHLHIQIAFCFSFENVYLPSFSTKVSKYICKKCNSISIMLICMETKALFLFQLILLWLFLSLEYNALVT